MNTKGSKKVTERSKEGENFAFCVLSYKVGHHVGKKVNMMDEIHLTSRKQTTTVRYKFPQIVHDQVKFMSQVTHDWRNIS